MSSRPVVACLTIGSSDSSGGAGIQGDLKAYASVGCFASAVVVGVTAQNTCGVSARFTVPIEIVAEQLEAVLGDLPVQAIKIGTTWSPALLRYLARRLPSLAIPIVLDPVMVTTAGASLSSDLEESLAILRAELMPLATIVTPNRAEAMMLAWLDRRGRDGASNAALAERLRRLGARAVVVSASEQDVDDWYADAGRSVRVPGVRHAIDAEHGVGCAHSSMLAGLLALGWPLFDAVVEARARASEAVRRGLVHLGNGRHPVDVLGLAQHTAEFTP